MGSESTENDVVPEKYLNHFTLLGHTERDLRKRWAQLSDQARANYKRVLGITPGVASDE